MAGSQPEFLESYFLSVYRRLEADALLYNRRLPHKGLVGAENELAIAATIRNFLPVRFGVEVSAIVIDRFGRRSRQADIVIYDAARFPTYFRKVFPVELVYGVIEVKTSLASGEAASALENLTSVFELNFRPALTPYWQTRTREEELRSTPPFGAIFAYTSESDRFETFASWFPWESVQRGVKLEVTPPAREIRSIAIAALDKGIIRMESSNGHVTRWMPTYEGPEGDARSIPVKLVSETVNVDPAKVLLHFLETLWNRVSTHDIHPGFDIRSYMSESLGTVVDATAAMRE
jgi:hypothetical protein